MLGEVGSLGGPSEAVAGSLDTSLSSLRERRGGSWSRLVAFV